MIVAPSRVTARTLLFSGRISASGSISDVRISTTRRNEPISVRLGASRDPTPLTA